MLIALALDFVPDAVDKAVHHAEQSKRVLELKLAQLEGLGEGEGDKEKVAKEIKDIKELLGDVEMKVRVLFSLPLSLSLLLLPRALIPSEQIEDLKVVPEEAPKTDKDLALEAFLLHAVSPSKTKGIVNNLNSLVKKKKVVAVPVDSENGELKRKAEEEVAKEGEGEKKAKSS